MLKPTPMKLKRFTDDADAIVIAGNAAFLSGASVGDVLLVLNIGAGIADGPISTEAIWGAEAIRLHQALELANETNAVLQKGYQVLAHEVEKLSAQLHMITSYEK